MFFFQLCKLSTAKIVILLLSTILSKYIFFFRNDLKKVVHVTARHSENSLVSIIASDLISKLKFKCDITERDLWKEPLVPYKIDHVVAKFKIMDGKGSEQDHETFEPVRTLASELNDTDILILSTPLWNMALPYLVKQYIDIVIQPGLYLFN